MSRGKSSTRQWTEKTSSRPARGATLFGWYGDLPLPLRQSRGAALADRARMSSMSYEGIITVEPGKRGGQPCVRGMRITVYDVLSYLASGMTHEEILEDFPYLTREDILACLSYAADRERRTLISA